MSNASADQPMLNDVGIWFAELDGFAELPFMEDGRRQPPMPDTKDLSM